MSDSASAIPIKIVISDAEIDAALAKLDSLEAGQSQARTTQQQLEDNFLSVPNTPAYDEDAAYSNFRQQQRDALFSENSLGGADEMRAGRLVSAGLSLAQGRIPTELIMREALQSAGLAGPWAMLAMFGLDIAMKGLAAAQAEIVFREKLAAHETQRRVNYQQAQRGVMTE